MDEFIEKLRNFIISNPPTDDKGNIKWWSESDWVENLNKILPDWRNYFINYLVWEKINNIFPKRYYKHFLEATLPFAPNEIVLQYLKSKNNDECKTALELIFENNAHLLTLELWNLADEETKSFLIEEIINKIKRYRPHIFDDLEMLIQDPEHFFKRRGINHLFYPLIESLAITETFFYEPYELTHPLWIKLMLLIENSKDKFSLIIIKKFKDELKEIYKRTLEKIKFINLTYPFEQLIISKNVMVDPSLLMNSEAVYKVINSINENSNKFSFFISKSFNNFLNNKENENQWYMIADFFECKNIIPPQKLIGILKEYKNNLNVFDIEMAPLFEKYSEFRNVLFRYTENKLLSEILFEEYIFLQEYSWIVAKSKKCFEKFKECGSSVLEFGNNSTDVIIKKTLKKQNDDFINTFDKLRAIGKWIAVGGSSASAFFSPYLSFYIGIGSGIFLLLDPD